MKLWYNDRLQVVAIGPDGPAHLEYIDVPAGTAVLPGDRLAADSLTLPHISDTPERLATAKSIQIGRINNRREREIDRGFSWGGYLWDCDDRSQMAIVLRVLMILGGAAWTQDFTWRTADNVDVPFAAASGFRSLVASLVDHVTACYANARQLKEQVKAAQTVSDVILIEVGSGWP